MQNASNVERETALALREAEREAQEAGIALTEDQRQRIIAVTTAKYAEKDAQDEINASLERAQKAQQKLNLLTQQREAILKQIEAADSEGDEEKLVELRDRLAEVDEKLVSARDNAVAMWRAVGGQEAATAIEQVRAGATEAQKLSEEASKTTVQWERVSDLFATGLTNAFMSFAEAIAEGEKASEAARRAFLKFAADFLIQIAQMIIQAAIFRALQAAFGGTSFGSMIGVPTGHTGGLTGSSRIGSGNSTRQVSPALFAFARRFHEGGIPGLKPGEVPAILQQNEEVLTRDDPRHALNGGGQSGRDGGGQAPTIINAVDGSDALEQALSQTRGGEILMNYVRANRTQFKAALEE
ncbi:MAG: hypothetical protein GVY29_00415 [Spirochaetes bacterium]|nr:hypothetical protein [Spirochaetota bacterium]